MPVTRDITFRAASSGRRLAAFIARPDADPDGAADAAGRHPAVIVIHEALGLNDDIRRIATVFADQGYVALAPDLMGPGFTPFCIARFMQGVGRVGTGRPYRELSAFHDWFARQPDVDPARMGMAGFCAGGGFVMLYAATEAQADGRELRAIAPFYGALPADESLIPKLCPTVASYGGRDAVFGKSGPVLDDALRDAGIERDVHTYETAGHSFMSHHEGLLGRIGPLTPMHTAFDEAASTDAWRRVLAFFDRHVKHAPATA